MLLRFISVLQFARMVGEFSRGRDEYIDFVEHFRQANSGAKDTPEVFTDMVAFLMGMPELKLRKHLFYIFQLSCLCLTTKLPGLPAIKFSGVDCNDPRSSLFDIIMPAQSYLANVANSVAVCTTVASLGTFKDLEFRFSSGNVPGDPWSHVDCFSEVGVGVRSKIVSPSSRAKVFFRVFFSRYSGHGNICASI